MLKKIVASGKEITPSKIVCVGRNYVDHIHELGNDVPDEMVLFIKPNSSIGCQFPESIEDIHYECELCFLVKDGSFSHVGVGLDLTKRRVQKILKEKGLPWERAKAFDGSALFSEFVKFNPETQNLMFGLSINGELTQQGDVHLMVHKPQDILREITSFMSLEDGDVVMTGTPKGVGSVNITDSFNAFLYDGDKLLIEKSWN